MGLAWPSVLSLIRIIEKAFLYDEIEICGTLTYPTHSAIMVNLPSASHKKMFVREGKKTVKPQFYKINILKNLAALTIQGIRMTMYKIFKI